MKRLAAQPQPGAFEERVQLLGSRRKGWPSAASNAARRAAAPPAAAAPGGSPATRGQPTSRPGRRGRCRRGGGSGRSRPGPRGDARSADADALGAAPFGEQPVARVARRFLDAAAGFGPSQPGSRAGCRARRASRRPSAPRRRFRPQPVIDGQPPGAAARRAQRSASSVSARLSGPPETATATTGRASNPPIASSAAAAPPASAARRSSRSARSRRGPARRRRFFFSASARFLDRGAGVREIVVELGQRDAGILLLIGAGQRHAELQQARRAPWSFSDSACSPRQRRSPPP